MRIQAAVHGLEPHRELPTLPRLQALRGQRRQMLIGIPRQLQTRRQAHGCALQLRRIGCEQKARVLAYALG